MTEAERKKKREYKRIWAARNREKYRSYGKRWRDTHRQENSDKNLRFRAEHPDYGREWREKNPTYHAEWYSKNRQKRREYMRRWKQGGGLLRSHKAKPFDNGCAMTYGEIAAALHMSITTVRQIEQEALAKLKREDLLKLQQLAALLEQVRAGRQRVEIRK